VPSDFEHFPYQKGEGVGLTLRRTLFVRANRDLARAMDGDVRVESVEGEGATFTLSLPIVSSPAP